MRNERQQHTEDDKKHRRDAAQSPTEANSEMAGLETAQTTPGHSLSAMDPRLPPSARQNAVMRMQQTQGNAAVRRFLAGRSNTIQRDPNTRFYR